MSGVNKAIVVGNLGGDPEIRTTHSGAPVASFSVATSEHWRDKATGERKERTTWHRVVVWNEALVRVAEQYLRKGSKVYVEGKMQTRDWTDKDGIKRYVTEIVLQGFQAQLAMLDRREGVPPAGSPDDYGETATRAAAPGGGRPAPDDEIPF